MDVRDLMKEWTIDDVSLDLIMTALTHSSYKGMGYNVEDNERLEFLGDAVLDLISAEILIKNPHLSEGGLTEMRKILVNNQRLAAIFDTVKLDRVIRVANEFTLSPKNKADFIEALFGAIFLDKGYQRCVQFWEFLQRDKKSDLNMKFSKTFAPLELSESSHPLKNAKSTLQEYSQQYLPNLLPEYTLIEKKGQDHDPVFTVEVRVYNPEHKNEFRCAIGTAKSKKTAELQAAKKMCDLLDLKYI